MPTARRNAARAVQKTGLTGVSSKGLNLDDAGSAEVLPIDKINVDPDYQRELRHDLVEQIRRDWDIVKAGPILVSQRKSGTLWCVDGQHRMVGAKLAGETEIFAHVVHGLTKKQEAELRYARNQRKADSVYEKFRTRLVMGDEKAERMVEICHQHGTAVNTSVNMHSGINAINAVETLYDLDYGVTLSKVFKALRDAYGPDSLCGRTVSVAMLKSVAWFLDRHVERKEANYKEYVARLGAVGIDDIDRKARSHKAAMGGSLWINYYRAMVELWNFRRQESKKLDWKVQGSITQLGDDQPASGWARKGDSRRK